MGAAVRRARALCVGAPDRGYVRPPAGPRRRSCRNPRSSAGRGVSRDEAADQIHRDTRTSPNSGPDLRPAQRRDSHRLRLFGRRNHGIAPAQCRALATASAAVKVSMRTAGLRLFSNLRSRRRDRCQGLQARWPSSLAPVMASAALPQSCSPANVLSSGEHRDDRRSRSPESWLSTILRRAWSTIALAPRPSSTRAEHAEWAAIRRP